MVGALGAERLIAGEQLAGAEREILDGQRAVTPAGRQRRIEAGLRQHVAVLQPDHRLDVGGIPLGTARVAVEPDEVQPLSLQVVEVGAIVRLVPRGRPGEEVVPRQRPADGERRVDARRCGRIGRGGSLDEYADAHEDKEHLPAR